MMFTKDFFVKAVMFNIIGAEMVDPNFEGLTNEFMAATALGYDIYYQKDQRDLLDSRNKFRWVVTLNGRQVSHDFYTQHYSEGLKIGTMFAKFHDAVTGEDEIPFTVIRFEWQVDPQHYSVARSLIERFTVFRDHTQWLSSLNYETRIPPRDKE